MVSWSHLLASASVDGSSRQSAGGAMAAIGTLDSVMVVYRGGTEKDCCAIVMVVSLSCSSVEIYMANV